MMLDYIVKKDDNKIYVSENNQYFAYDMTIQKFINQRLIYRLSNVEALEKVTRKVFGFKSKIPLYIDEETLLMCIGSLRLSSSLYINYFAISKYEISKDAINVYFYNAHCLRIANTYAFGKQIIKCRTILEKIKI